MSPVNPGWVQVLGRHTIANLSEVRPPPRLRTLLLGGKVFLEDKPRGSAISALPLGIAPRQSSLGTGSVQFSVSAYIYQWFVACSRKLTPRVFVYDLRVNNEIGDIHKKWRYGGMSVTN